MYDVCSAEGGAAAYSVILECYAPKNCKWLHGYFLVTETSEGRKTEMLLSLHQEIRSTEHCCLIRDNTVDMKATNTNSYSITINIQCSSNTPLSTYALDHHQKQRVTDV